MNLNCIIEIQCFLGGGGTPLLCHLKGYGFQGLASNLLSPNNDQHQISPHHIYAYQCIITHTGHKNLANDHQT